MNIIWDSITIEKLALLISFIALIISVISATYSKYHNSLSVRPLLIFRSSTYMIKGKIHLQIFNKGLGPLLFEHFNFEIDKKTFTSGTDLFNYLGTKIGIKKKDLEIEYRQFTYPLHNMGMASNDEKTLIKLKLKKDKLNKAQELYDLLKKIEIKYKYKDFYNNKVSGTYNYGRDFHGE